MITAARTDWGRKKRSGVKKQKRYYNRRTGKNTRKACNRPGL